MARRFSPRRPSQRILGVDYGERRIGLAVSDPMGRIALPYRIVSSLRDVISAAAEVGAAAVVVGLPLTLGRRESASSRAVRAFAARLGAAVQLPIAFEDETFTTKLAARSAPARRVDAAAAALILQSYLDRMDSKFKM